jgi:Na+/H+ antiporter NhaC
LLLACLLVALPLAAQDPAAPTRSVAGPLLDGPPPLEVDPPKIALNGRPAAITIRPASDIPRQARFEILDSEGTVRAAGTLGVDAETKAELTFHPLGDQAYRLQLPDLYRDGVPFTVRTVSGWLTVLPPLVAILLALVFRQVIPALLAGCWIGAWVVYDGAFVGALRTIDHYVVQTLNDADRVTILIFSLVLGGMVGVLARSGGTVGLVEALEPYATTSRRGQLVTWIMGILIFFDDYANTLLVGNTMRPVTDRLKVSREKLAYIVDSTAAPVASIALVSTWIGYEVSLIGDSLKQIGSEREPYVVFIQSLPYNFYPILALVFGLLVASSRRDFGSMLKAERRASAGKVIADGATPLSDFDTTALDPPEGQPRRWVNAVAPVAVVLLVTFLGLWFTGLVSLAESGYERGTASPLRYVGDVFSSGNSLTSLLWASVAGSLIALVLAVVQRILSVGDAVGAWVSGLRSMTMAYVILVLAWSIADVCTDLDTRGYLAGSLSDNLDPRLLPALIFVLASLTAFATGTSWGVMGILIPLAVPITHDLTQAAGLDPATSYGLLLGAVSAVLAGAIFGDHCSPISDTTVLSSMASGCDHVDHVRTQLPYALVVAAVAMLLCYLPSGWFGFSPFICLLAGSAVLVGILFLLGRRRSA